VQHHAADELHVEVPHVEHAAAGLAHHGEGLGQEVVERLALGVAFAEFRGACAHLAVRERARAGLQLADAADDGVQPLQLPVVLGADDFRKELVDHARR
jgi:hypothetical protein